MPWLAGGWFDFRADACRSKEIWVD